MIVPQNDKRLLFYDIISITQGVTVHSIIAPSNINGVTTNTKLSTKNIIVFFNPS